MGCGCKGRQKVKKSSSDPPSVMGNYKYLNSAQIKKRLEVFKRLYCGNCDHKQECDYVMYESCEKVVELKK